MSGLGKEGSVAGVILKLAWAFFFFFFQYQPLQLVIAFGPGTS